VKLCAHHMQTKDLCLLFLFTAYLMKHWIAQVGQSNDMMNLKRYGRKQEWLEGLRKIVTNSNHESSLFCDVMQGWLVVNYQHFGTTDWSFLQGSDSPKRILLGHHKRAKISFTQHQKPEITNSSHAKFEFWTSQHKAGLLTQPQCLVRRFSVK